jgi:NADH:ubiquinone oxidoreductase subunit 3 (subunit A)
MTLIRWPSYLLILIAALLGVVIPLILPQLWRMGAKKAARSTPKTRDGVKSGDFSAPITIRFHLAALLFTGVLGMVVLLIPLLFSIHGPNGSTSALVLAAIAVPTLILVFYCLRKGDLSWSVPKSKDHALADEEERR